MRRNPFIERAVLDYVTAHPLASSAEVCRHVNRNGQSNASSVKNALRALAWEDQIVNVGDTVAAWKLVK